MAVVYGSMVGNWRAYLDYGVSTSDTAVTITVNGAGMQSVGWGFQITYNTISTTVSLTGQASKSGSGNFYSDYGATVAKSYVSGSWTIPRTTSAQTLTLAAQTKNESGYQVGTSQLSVNVSIPALASWKVSYNANGGSGAPGQQTKWYGQSLTLSSVRPTRSGYTFRGWATSSGGSVAYQPGATYTSNASLTLYAVWTLDYIAPSLSGVKAVRCTSDGTASDSGTYVKVTGSYKARQSGNKITSVKVEYKLTTASTWTAATTTNPNAASGSISLTTGGGKLDADLSYDIRVTVSDAGGSTSSTVRVAGQYYLMDVGNKGRAVAFGGAATEDGFAVKMDADFTGDLKHNGYPVQHLGVAVAGNNAAFGSSDTKVWRRFASCNITTGNTDREVTFLVSPAYGNLASDAGSAFGILTAHLRSGPNVESVQVAELYWHYAGPSVDFSNYVLCYKLTSGSSLYAELWVRNVTGWSTPAFQVMSDRDRVTGHTPNWGWALYYNVTGGSGSTGAPGSGSGYTQVISRPALIEKELDYGYAVVRNGMCCTIARKTKRDVTIKGNWGNVVLGTLPVGWRPLNWVYGQCMNLAEGQNVYIEVLTDGKVQLVNGGNDWTGQADACVTWVIGG